MQTNNRKQKMRVLIGCEFSGRVREAFRKLGHDAYSCDLLPSDDNSPYHYQCNVLDILNNSWDLAIFHPPCTFLTNAGVRHLHENVTSKNGVKAKISGKQRWYEMERAAEFFNELKDAPIEKICIENPIPHRYARERIGKYTQIIQPWMFGHKETKATCLWLKNLPLLQSTFVVGPPPKNMTMEEKRSWHRIHHTSPSKDRWKKRSVTFEGIARAMATQWS